MFSRAWQSVTSLLSGSSSTNLKPAKEKNESTAEPSVTVPTEIKGGGRGGRGARGARGHRGGRGFRGIRGIRGIHEKHREERSTGERGRQYYCPYIGCRNTFRLRLNTFEHIRNSHDYTFYPERSSNITFTDPNGKPILFDHNEGAGPSKRRIIDSDSDKGAVEQFYCPYEGCDASYPETTRVHYHIRKVHYPELTKVGAGRPNIHKTADGIPIHFDEKSRNLLRKGDKLFRERVLPEEETYHYCPYKGCLSACRTETHFVKHIRKSHNRAFPRFTAENVLIDSSGAPFDVKAGVRDVLENGEVLLVLENSSNTSCAQDDTATTETFANGKIIPYEKQYVAEYKLLLLTMKGRIHRIMIQRKVSKAQDADEFSLTKVIGRFWCPYKNCNTSYVFLRDAYKHIRAKHYTGLSKIAGGRFCLHKTTDGTIIQFDQTSRDLLEDGEAIVREIGLSGILKSTSCR
ncbi:hypothetical protein BJV82DRAFT_575384 [Fennellomyces sp. T-0311]|nr:hypothetical protein BJV82DRAFT_575384 [Fennellomyces sp. T-0311]